MEGQILITTSGLNEEFEIIDSIFALDSSSAGLFFGADPNAAFDKVKEQLRKKCKQLGGDAVINCQFEYRVAVADGLLGSKQVIEIFAYGTAVRLN
ncbi:MAG: heavy metal-binding domain-containing protein [Bacilli bacterium]|nr:heavy metal-binding domain-containing protein [Bacilli bacterium]